MGTVQIILTILGPCFFLYFKNNKLICAISPVVCCYLLGIAFANIPGIEVNASISKMATEASVPLAIPLLLLSTNFIKWIRLARSTVISFILIIITVCVVSASVSLIFKSDFEHYWKLAGMMVGVYTGGTPNMTAIGLALGVEESVFVLMNGADLLLGAGYLLFILTFGLRLMGWILPSFKKSENFVEEESLNAWSKLGVKLKMRNTISLILFSAACLGLSLGLSNLFFGADEVAFIILIITTLGIGFSFIEKVRNFIGSYEVGQYLLLIFCVGIGSMANIESLMQGSLNYLIFLGVVMLLSITIHVFLCRLFKIDRDTAIITSVAGIFGPPFVGPVADRIGNREIVVSGLTSGLVGYAVGNYLGLAIAYLVRAM